MNRRSFLSRAALCSAGALLGSKLPASPPTGLSVIDAHIHLFDPTRPGGVPWPEPGDLIYKPALPSRYAQVSAPFGVVGAIAIEASPLRTDNDWVLDLIGKNPIMVGMIGDLDLRTAEFPRDLERLRRNPLFLGIRYGNLWKRDLATDRSAPGFIAAVKTLAQAGLVLETSNPDPALIEAVLRIAQAVPDLTIVVDHLPHLQPPPDAAGRKAYEANLAELAQSPHVFVKLSEIVTDDEGSEAPSEGRYARRLDPLWALFGPDRVIFGSDWPNSDHIATYQETFAVVRNYVSAKGHAAAERFFAKNSQTAYKWKPRRPNQQVERIS